LSCVKLLTPLLLFASCSLAGWWAFAPKGLCFVRSVGDTAWRSWVYVDSAGKAGYADSARGAAFLGGYAASAYPRLAAANTFSASPQTFDTIDFKKLRGGLTPINTGYYATVAGGISDTASDTCAVVSGGSGNKASAKFAAIGGGKNNKAQYEFATIAGGSGNKAVDYSFIGGGSGGLAYANYTVVVGGQSNSATGVNGAVVGGGSNVATGFAFVGGGYGNRASGSYSSIPGGTNDTASGVASFVGGGIGNNATDSCSRAGGINARALKFEDVYTEPGGRCKRITNVDSAGTQKGITGTFSGNVSIGGTFSFWGVVMDSSQYINDTLYWWKAGKRAVIGVFATP